MELAVSSIRLLFYRRRKPHYPLWMGPKFGLDAVEIEESLDPAEIERRFLDLPACSLLALPTKLSLLPHNTQELCAIPNFIHCHQRFWSTNQIECNLVGSIVSAQDTAKGNPFVLHIISIHVCHTAWINLTRLQLRICLCSLLESQTPSGY
jgi:hypothetical protein